MAIKKNNSIATDTASTLKRIASLEENLPYQADVDAFSAVTLELVDLHDRLGGTAHTDRATHLLFLTLQAYIKSRRLVRALYWLDRLKKRKGTQTQVKLVQRWMVETFSNQRAEKVTKGPDDFAVPNFSFQEFKASVAFDSDNLWVDREQLEPLVIERSSLFSVLDAKEFERMSLLGRFIEVDPGKTLFKEGDSAKSFYLVVEGQIEMRTQSGVRKVFREGQFFGEIALFLKSKRTATFHSEPGCKLLEFSEAALNRAMKEMPTLEAKIFSFFETRLFLNAASRNPLFKSFSQSDLEDLAEVLVPIHVPKNRKLITENSASDRFYIVTHGYLRVEKKGKEVSKLGPGHFVGEVGLIFKRKRTADVIAHTEAHLLECQVKDFQELLEQYPKWKRLIEEVSKMREPAEEFVPRGLGDEDSEITEEREPIFDA